MGVFGVFVMGSTTYSFSTLLSFMSTSGFKHVPENPVVFLHELDFVSSMYNLSLKNLLPSVYLEPSVEPVLLKNRLKGKKQNYE